MSLVAHYVHRGVQVVLQELYGRKLHIDVTNCVSCGRRRAGKARQ